jgi:hypothetical protein
MIFIPGIGAHPSYNGKLWKYIKSRNIYFITHRNHYNSSSHKDFNYDVCVDDIYRFI